MVEALSAFLTLPLPTIDMAEERTVFGELSALLAASAANTALSLCIFTYALNARFARPFPYASGYSLRSEKTRFSSNDFLDASRIETLCTFVTCVFASITDAPLASFMVCLGYWAPTCFDIISICSA